MLVAGFKEYLKNRRFVQYFYKLQKQMIRFLNDLPCEQTEYEEDYVILTTNLYCQTTEQDKAEALAKIEW